MPVPFPAESLQRTKELFPRIYDGIYLLWGHPELRQYLNKLMLNEGNVDKAGFPPDVLKEISFLHAMPDDDLWELLHLK